jgi:RNA polymerase sigma factor for flagellar operon FliA
MSAAQVINESQSNVLRHYSMVRAIAYKIHQRLLRTVEVDDLVSVGVIGLMEAIERYDASRAVPFETYARHRIHGAIMDNLRATDWVPRSVRRKAQQIGVAKTRLEDRLGRAPSQAEIADDMDITVNKLEKMVQTSEIRQLLSLDAPVAMDNPTPLIEQVARDDDDVLAKWEDTQVKDALIQAIEHLPAREREAISLYYLHELSLKQVGAELGVTESRACQICSSAVKRLRFRMRSVM